MIKNYLLIITMVLSSFNLFADDILMGSQVADLFHCDSTNSFYDSGGSGAGYSAGENNVLTICPQLGVTNPTFGFITFIFDSANFSHAGDFLAFYDDANTTDPALLLNLFNQADIPAPGTVIRPTTSNVSGCITVQFASDAASAGGNFAFSMACNVPCKTIEADFPTSTPPVQVDEPNYINNCTSDPITFTGNGIYENSVLYYTQDDATSTFTWDFGTLGTETGQTVTKNFPTGIHPVTLTVEDVEGCKSKNVINLKVRRAFDPNVKFTPQDTVLCPNKTFDLAPYIITSTGETLLIGDTAVVDTLQLINSVAIVDTLTLPDDANGTSGDGITTPAFYEFPISGYILGSTLQNATDLVDVCLSIEHSFVGDLDIVLECPNGQTVNLVDMTPPGTPGWDFGEEVAGVNAAQQGVPYTYCWSPTANTANVIAEGNANVIANILPNGAVDTAVQYNITGNAWGSLIGCPLNGIWEIKVFDDYGGDDGNVFGASIQFADGFEADSDTFLVSYTNAFWDNSNQIITDINNDSITVQTVNQVFETLVLNFEDNLGCEHTADYTILIDTTFNISITPTDTTICFGTASSPITLEAIDPDNVNSCDFSIEMFDNAFFGGDTWNGNSVTVFIDNVNQGNFTIDATDADPAYSLETFNVEEGQEIKVQYNGGGNWMNENSFNILDPDGNLLHFQSTGVIGVNFTTIASCNVPNTFVWGPSITATTQSVVVNSPASTSDYYVVATNHNGCVSSDTATINIITVPVTISNNTEVCQGESVNLNATGADTYTWTPATGLSATNIANPTATPAIPTTYFVEYNTLGCTVYDSVKVEVLPLPIREINNGVDPIEFCEGSEATLSVQDQTNWTFNWSGLETSTDHEFDVTTPGDYTVTFNNGICEDSRTVTVLAPNALPVFDFSGIDTILCCTDDAEEILFASVVSNVTLQNVYWNGMETQSSSETVVSDPNGNNANELNHLRVRSNKGCEAETELPYITTKCADPRYVGHDTVFLNTTQVFDLTVNETNSTTTAYNWTTTQTGAIIDETVEDAGVMGVTEGIYTIGFSVTNSYDGKDELCTEVAETKDYEVVMIPDPQYPDAFTPKNGDALNDLYRPVISQFAKINDFRIYNRWGQLIYDMSTADNKDGWDGSWNGVDQKAAMYRYFISISHPDRDFVREGNVTLIR